MHQYCRIFGEDSLKTFTLVGGGENPLRFFEHIEKGDSKRRRFKHTFSAILSTPFLKVWSPGHLRSGHQVTSIEPTS